MNSTLNYTENEFWNRLQNVFAIQLTQNYRNCIFRNLSTMKMSENLWVYVICLLQNVEKLAETHTSIIVNLYLLATSVKTLIIKMGWSNVSKTKCKIIFPLTWLKSMEPIVPFYKISNLKFRALKWISQRYF